MLIHNKQLPVDIFEARQRLQSVDAEYRLLKEELSEATRFDVRLGREMTEDEFSDWKSRATLALKHMRYEKIVCSQFIEQYERESLLEEQHETRKAERQEKLQRSEQHKSMLEEHAKRRQAERQEKLQRSEQHKSMLEEHAKRRQVKRDHQLHLAALAVGEDIDPNDTENLLRSAWRLLRKLAREHRVTYTDEEISLIEIIRDKELYKLTQNESEGSELEVEDA